MLPRDAVGEDDIEGKDELVVGAVVDDAVAGDGVRGLDVDDEIGVL